MPQLAFVNAYWVCVGLGALGIALTCGAARRSTGRWREAALRVLGAALGLDGVAWLVATSTSGTWSPRGSLPLALCDVALLVAAVACWWPRPLLVELTYFWGLAGTLQAVITPDLTASFPHLEFFEYVVAHVGIVWAALFLVVGMRFAPRPGAVRRVFTISVAYTAVVGVVDAITGGDYMFLRAPPRQWTLLRVLGPWPYYLLSASVLALVLFALLDAPLRARRRREGASEWVAGRRRNRPEGALAP